MPRSTMNRSDKRGRKAAGSYKLLLFFLLVAVLAGTVIWKAPTSLVGAIAGTLDLRSEAPGARLVYSEMLGDASVIWEAPASDLRKKRQLGSVPHIQGYGIKASLSPDGWYLAYKALDHDSGGSTSRSSLWLLDTEIQRTSFVLDGLELISVPLWSPDSDKVAVIRTSVDDDGPNAAEIVAVDIHSGTANVIATSQPQEWVSPVAWSADGGRLYYVSIGGQGTYLNYSSAHAGGLSQVLGRLDDFSRDFRLSPDREMLAYTSLENATEPAIKTLNLSDGAVKSYPGMVSPLWDAPDGALTVAALSNGLGVSKIRPSDLSIDATTPPTELYSAPINALHLPLAWSRDAGFLAVRSLSGTSLNDVTDERLGVVDTGGAFRPVESAGYLEFIGWLP